MKPLVVFTSFRHFWVKSKGIGFRIGEVRAKKELKGVGGLFFPKVTRLNVIIYLVTICRNRC